MQHHPSSAQNPPKFARTIRTAKKVKNQKKASISHIKHKNHLQTCQQHRLSKSLSPPRNPLKVELREHLTKNLRSKFQTTISWEVGAQTTIPSSCRQSPNTRMTGRRSPANFKRPLARRSLPSSLKIDTNPSMQAKRRPSSPSHVTTTSRSVFSSTRLG